MNTTVCAKPGMGTNQSKMGKRQDYFDLAVGT